MSSSHNVIRKFLGRSLPPFARAWVKAGLARRRGSIAVGSVRWGDLRRLSPVSQVFGFDRGAPIDRYYIEGFLGVNSADVRGTVLEAGNSVYTTQFGGAAVSRSEVLHITEGAPHATIIGDLRSAPHIPSATFDCVILTQTLHLIYETEAALRTVKRILKPNGVLLATIPGLSQIGRDEWGKSWYWGFTRGSATRLFNEVFGEANVDVRVYGNVLSATSFLQGLATEELTQAELDHLDEAYQVTIGVRAVNSAD